MKPILHRLSASSRRFTTDTGGGIAILAAFFLTIALLLGAYAVDAGALYLQRREAQNVADLTAIAAAADLQNMAGAAKDSLSSNGYDVVSIEPVSSSGGDVVAGAAEEKAAAAHSVRVEKGHYVADVKVPPADRFQAGPGPHNAVRVTLSRTGSLFFSASFMAPPKITTQSVAQSEAHAAFSVGSRLASLNGGVLNSLLGGLTGSNISLSVMDYRGLIDAQVDLFGLLDMLASDIGLSGGTYDTLLAANVNLATLAKAAAKVAQGNAAASLALARMANDAAFAGHEVPLDTLIKLGDIGRMKIGDPHAAFAAGVSAMDLIVNAAAANGENQIDLDLAAAVPGLASLKAKLLIGERMQDSPWIAIGTTGGIVRTAQTRLHVEAAVGGQGALAGASVRLPLYVEVAYAEAELKKVSCPASVVTRATASLSVRPGVAGLWVGEIDPKAMRRFDAAPGVKPATIVALPAIKVHAHSHVDVGNITARQVSFSYQEIMSGTIKSVSTTTPVQSLVSSALKNLAVDVDVAGLGLSLPANISGAVASSLQPVAKPLDEALETLLSALGVKLGEADVRVNGIKCQRAVVVQ